jgi:GTP cyclohydrolase I
VARGWESKSVEQQQAEVLSDGAQKRPRQSLEQLGLQRKREGILLTRQRILQQLQAAQNPRHREMLEAALADLNAQLSRLG